MCTNSSVSVFFDITPYPLPRIQVIFPAAVRQIALTLFRLSVFAGKGSGFRVKFHRFVTGQKVTRFKQPSRAARNSATFSAARRSGFFRSTFYIFFSAATRCFVNFFLRPRFTRWLFSAFERERFYVWTTFRFAVCLEKLFYNNLPIYSVFLRLIIITFRLCNKDLSTRDSIVAHDWYLRYVSFSIFLFLIVLPLANIGGPINKMLVLRIFSEFTSSKHFFSNSLLPYSIVELQEP